MFADTNSDGRRGRGEMPVPNRPIWIDMNRNARLDRGEPSARTRVDGTFVVSGIVNGEHLLRVSLLAGWWRTFPARGAHTVTIRAGAPRVLGKDFAITDRVMLRGSIFDDRNGSRRFDAGDVPMRGGWVYIDADRDGKFDAGELRSGTDVNGSWPGRAFPRHAHDPPGAERRVATRDASCADDHHRPGALAHNHALRAAAPDVRQAKAKMRIGLGRVGTSWEKCSTRQPLALIHWGKASPVCRPGSESSTRPPGWRCSRQNASRNGHCTRW